MNRKTIIVNVVITIILLIGYHLFFSPKSYSLAYVNTSKIMSDFKGMIEARKAIDVKEKDWQATINKLAVGLQADITKYEKEKGKMSEREKKTNEELLGQKQQQILQFKDSSKNKLAEEEQKINDDAIAKINDLITEYGKKHNYTIVFGTTSGNIVYANETINITDKVLELLNK